MITTILVASLIWNLILLLVISKQGQQIEVLKWGKR